MKDAQHLYIDQFSTEQDSVLQWLERQTNLRTNHSRMLCGAVVGKLLEFISGMIAPESILELGAFTGYSSICLARGLKEGGHLHSIEINDELEDLILEAHEKAGMQDKITLIGCPKLDMVDYSEKLTEVFKYNNICSITVTRMTVPCCGGLSHAVKTAVANSGKNIPLHIVTISPDGRIIK